MATGTARQAHSDRPVASFFVVLENERMDRKNETSLVQGAHGDHVNSKPIRIGVISDTHNLVRPGALALLQGCDHIVHAGDVCGPDVLAQLATLAPVTAVRGNNDVGPWAQSLRESELIRLGGVYIYVVHDLAQLDIDPQAAGVQIIVSGPSHQPGLEEANGVLYLNPGIAGPRRFKLPISLAEITIDNGNIAAHLHALSM